MTISLSMTGDLTGEESDLDRGRITEDIGDRGLKSSSQLPAVAVTAAAAVTRLGLESFEEKCRWKERSSSTVGWGPHTGVPAGVAPGWGDWE